MDEINFYLLIEVRLVEVHPMDGSEKVTVKTFEDFKLAEKYYIDLSKKSYRDQWSNASIKIIHVSTQPTP